MPCKFCASPTHTLSKCDSPFAGELVATVNILLTISPFNIRHQVECLKQYNNVHLSVVCRSIYGVPCNGTKSESIKYILANQFNKIVEQVLLTFNQATTDSIDDAYTEIADWMPTEKDAGIKSYLLFNMDIYYSRRYGLRRYGFPIALFHEGLQYLQAQRTVTVNPHIDKLLINVTVEPELPIEECCVCLNDKQMSRFNCGHRCCPECILKVAQKRTKLFISCPLCRAKIQNILVIDQDIQNLMNLEINAC